MRVVEWKRRIRDQGSLNIWKGASKNSVNGTKDGLGTLGHGLPRHVVCGRKKGEVDDGKIS